MDPISVTSHLRTISGTGQLGRPEVELVPPRPVQAADESAPTFSQALNDSLQKVNERMLHSDRMVEDLATGRSTDIHGTMIAMQKADISFRMVLEVRNKVMRAYEEIMRMQV